MLTAFPKCWHRSILVAIKTEHQRRFLIWSPSRDALKERTGRVIPPGRQLCSYKTISLTRKAFFFFLFLSHSLSLSCFFRELSPDLTERCVWLQAEPSALFFFHSCQTDLAVEKLPCETLFETQTYPKENKWISFGLILPFFLVNSKIQAILHQKAEWSS